MREKWTVTVRKLSLICKACLKDSSKNSSLHTYNFGSNGRLNVTFRLGVTTRRLNSVLDGIHDRKLAIYFAGSRTNYAHQHAQVRVFRRSR